MAGLGIALADGIHATDINPAGLVDDHKIAVAFSQNIIMYRYMLHNKRVDENLARIFEWNSTEYYPESFIVSYSVAEQYAFAIGYLSKIQPYIYNQRRAITWSPLFNQETSGAIQTVVLSAAYRITESLALGLNGYFYFGKVKSKVRGENHGNDTDKWAKLNSSFSGSGFKIGIKYTGQNFGVGTTLKSPDVLQVSTGKSISDNPLYSYLFPEYQKTKFNLPLNMGLGIYYILLSDYKISLDYEYRRFQKSDLQINLFEYGGQPNWKDVQIVRVGLEYTDPTEEWFPIRIGYAYIPQLYTSNHSEGSGNTITSYQNREQNIKHVFTFGSSFNFSEYELDIAFKYGFINWKRTLTTHITILDDYSEDSYSINSQLIYFLR